MILLSFDVEEFDLPLEYGQDLLLKDQLTISTIGTDLILNLLSNLSIKATFYCTAIYARHQPEIIKRIVEEGHELASHGVEHSCFKKDHLKESIENLEEISGVKIFGFRMPRLAPVDTHLIGEAGYKYNSSINPTWIPGRYNNFFNSRTVRKTNGMIDFPVSVSTMFRIPLFWLSFHHLPLSILRWLSKLANKRDNYIHLYFHPWEFTDLKDKEILGFLPNYITKKSGYELLYLLENYLIWAKSQDIQFLTTKAFLQEWFEEKWM